MQRDRRHLFLDVDATCLTDAHVLTDATVEAVGRALAAGLGVHLATGRSPDAAREVARRLGLGDALAICLNGAWTGYLGARPEADRCVDREPLDESTGRELVEAAGRADADPVWFTTDGSWCLGDGPLVALERRATGVVPTRVSRPDEASGEICKVNLLERPDRGFDRTALERRHGREVELVRSTGFLEATRPGVTKRSAVERALGTLGTARERIVAVGDSGNDLELIRWAGLGIAMGNAREDVRAAADAVTLDNEHDGVAAAIDRLLEGSRHGVQPVPPTT